MSAWTRELADQVLRHARRAPRLFGRGRGQVAAALAVADAAGASRFSLFGASQGGQLAATIAARYPERVETLVLYGTCASGRDLLPARARESVVALVRAHWGLGLKALAGAFVTDPTAADMAAFTGKAVG